MAHIGTPICDFVRRYAQGDTLRLHMPGHKGSALIGPEMLDLTELQGADSLFEAQGIIAQSEQNATALFGAHTLYSTEGASLCIRAMLALVLQNAPKRGEKPLILAGRNAHRTFHTALALLDLDVAWLYPCAAESYLSCTVTPAALEHRLAQMPQKPAAVYITSPDYLGHMADIRGLAAVCHAHGVWLLVDNAHGAYLRFLQPSVHPVDLGADLCCSSAHKTLPALTGGAYLHISHHVAAPFADHAKAAMALFASTSPSYLILQSLDAVNAYLAVQPTRYADFAALASRARARLQGYTFVGDEPLKWTLSAKPYGYSGTELADALRAQGVECEFADPDYTVLMLSPALGEAGLARLTAALAAIPRRAPIMLSPPALQQAERVCSPRTALLSPRECLPIAQCAGRVLADASIGCPPAVPILCCGERITHAALSAFAYYGITHCAVTKE